MQRREQCNPESRRNEAKHRGTRIRLMNDLWPEASAGAEFFKPTLVVIENTAQGHEILVGQRGEGDDAFAEQTMPDRQSDVDGSLFDTFEMDMFLQGVEAQTGIGNINRVALQRFHLLARIKLVDVDFDFWKPRPEAPDDFCQRWRQVAEGIGNPQPPRHAALGFPRIGDSLARMGDDRAGFRQKHQAGLGQGHAAFAADDQRDTHLLLKILNLPANGGVRNVQPGGGAPNVQFFGHGDKIAKMPEFHVLICRLW